MAKFKRLINEINIPIIITSQLSREPEKRENHRPVLSDFKKSSSIAQNSDIVIFLYSDSHYLKGYWIMVSSKKIDETQEPVI